MVLRRAPGFTLIELVVTVAIVGILATAIAPIASITRQRVKEAELRSSLRQIREGIDAYKRAVDEGRITRQAQETGYPKTLDLLVEGVVDAKSPEKRRIYFLRRLPRDPFAANPAAPAAATWGKRSYASPPDEPKEGDDVYDVHSLSTARGLNGVAYREW